MSKLNKIVYLSEEQKNTLFQNNSITVNGKTITYNDNDLYLTPLAIVTGVKGDNENEFRSGDIIITKDNIGLGNVENIKLSDWAGSEKITKIGTLTDGTIPWARLSDIPSASTTAPGIIQIGTGETNAAAGNHIHAISLNKNNIDSSQITLDYGEKYKLTAGNNSITFTMPNKINAASATNNILHGTSTETEITYAPYTSQQNRLSFDTSTSAPTGIDRLNLNGQLYATKLYSNGKEVLTTVSNTTNENTTATQFVYSITQNNNGEISVTTCSLPTYNNYVLPTATDNDLGGIKTGFSTSSTSDKNYAIKVDNNGNAYVNVPWENTHQDISGKLDKIGGTITGPLILDYEFSGEKYAVSKQYVDGILTTNDALLFKGVLGIETAPGIISSLPPTNDEPEYKQGWVYKVGAAGIYAGQHCEIGDTIYCIADGTTANNANWVVLQTNIDGYVFGPTDTTTAITTNSIALFTGSTGKAIKDSQILIDENNNLIPNSRNNYSIGSISKAWKNIYLGDNGLSFTDIEGTKLKSSIYHNNNDLYLETNNGNIVLKLTTTAVDDNTNNTTFSRVVISNTATSIQTEGTITLQKNNESKKSVSLVFDDTINALNFVFTEED